MRVELDLDLGIPRSRYVDLGRNPIHPSLHVPYAFIFDPNLLVGILHVPRLDSVNPPPSFLLSLCRERRGRQGRWAALFDSCGVRLLYWL